MAVFESMKELENSEIEVVKEITMGEYYQKFVQEPFEKGLISEEEVDRRHTTADGRFLESAITDITFLEDGHVFWNKNWNGEQYDYMFTPVSVKVADDDYDVVGYEIETYAKPTFEQFTIPSNK